MVRSPRTHRIAMLLTGLGPEFGSAILSGMDGAMAAEVRAQLKVFEKQPPAARELDLVIDEFETFLRFAMDTMNAPSNWNELLFADEGEDETVQVNSPRPKKPNLRIFEPSDDPFENLSRLDPVQIAGALASEHPKTIGMVLSRMDNSAAAATLDLLPQHVQAAAFFTMNDQANFSEELISRVVRTTVEQAILIEPVKTETKDADQKTADLLRQLPRATRTRLITSLEETDPERSSRVGKLLYLFEDIALYENRSIQKLLAQFDTKTLVIGLQDVDDAVLTAIMQNLSKRAASSLQEEIEFKGKSTDEEVTAARTALAELIGKLDLAGELTIRN